MSELRPTDTTRPATWHDAFAQLPHEAPPPGGWDALQARLADTAPVSRRTRWPLWAGLAASLLLAVALPMHWLADDAPDATSTPSTTGASIAGAPAAGPSTDRRLDALRDESARLEALLPLVSDDRVASGSSALMTGELELRLAGIDADLRAPSLTPQAEQTLWEARVHTLHTLARLETERSWLAAQGSRFDAALVRVD
ncbi:hypothetical protein [Luteimonas abyssi]|uniref:hypothetical protein n=1 Tax=Luteimonas abyssi TaxID=1247514 RepID=UPI000737CCEE|nr:hypothetical protein [Luteimonas abyssi]